MKLPKLFSYTSSYKVIKIIKVESASASACWNELRTRCRWKVKSALNIKVGSGPSSVSNFDFALLDWIKMRQ